MNEYLDLSDLAKLKATNLQNYQLVEDLGFNNNMYDYTSENIKRLLLTNKGIEFIMNFNDYSNKQTWNITIRHNDIQLLKGLQSNGIKMRLLNDELVDIIKSFRLVYYYETFEFLVNNYIRLNDTVALDLIKVVLYNLRTPNNEKQQNSQLEIYKKLINYQLVKEWVKINFDYIIWSLNIPLVNFVYYSNNDLQLVVIYLINNQNSIELATKMFEYLLINLQEIDKRNSNRNNVYHHINRLTNISIKYKLNTCI